MSDIIEVWKKLKVDHVNFEFNCGGDNMGDTDVLIYDEEDNEIKSKEIEEYIDAEVYNNVEFYVNSDGHYQGEAGTVTVTMEEDELCYSKSSQSEWSEQETKDFILRLTKIHKELLKKLGITRFDGDRDDIEPFFSKDVIITEKEEKTIEDIQTKITEKACKEYPDEGDSEDYYTLEAVVQKDGNLNITANYSMTIYKDE